MVYDITDLDNVTFVEYVNSRNFSVLYDKDIRPPINGGDTAPEQLWFIEEEVYGKALVFGAFTESSSILIYSVDCGTATTSEPITTTTTTTTTTTSSTSDENAVNEQNENEPYDPQQVDMSTSGAVYGVVISLLVIIIIIIVLCYYGYSKQNVKSKVRASVDLGGPSKTELAPLEVETK